MTKPLFIGIAGGTASGKTTLAASFVEFLGPELCLRLTHDRYYKTLPDSFRANPAAYNYDAPEALETDLMVQNLRDLADGKGVDVPIYDFAQHSRTGIEHLEPKPIIVVEGILIYTEPELCELLDLRVFVDTPEYVRLSRRVIRDQIERGRHMEQIFEQYFHTVRPMHEKYVEPSKSQGQLMLDGTESVGKLVSTLMGRLPMRYQKSSSA